MNSSAVQVEARGEKLESIFSGRLDSRTLATAVRVITRARDP